MQVNTNYVRTTIKRRPGSKATSVSHSQSLGLEFFDISHGSSCQIINNLFKQTNKKLHPYQSRKKEARQKMIICLTLAGESASFGPDFSDISQSSSCQIVYKLFMQILFLTNLWCRPTTLAATDFGNFKDG